MVQWDDATYSIPAYSVTDAARYLRIPLGTLRSWLKGRSYATKNGHQAFEPLIQRPDPALPQLSFTNLIEAHVLKKFIQGINLPSSPKSTKAVK